MIRRITLFFLIALAALSTSAAELEVVVDPAASEVKFKLKATLHTVHGTVGVADGKLTIDTDTREISGEVVVDAVGAETGNTSRDKKMHSKVLLTERHPTIALRPQRFTGDLRREGESTITLIGTMELSGTRHALEVPVTVTIDGDRAKAEADFLVPYVEWGLKNPSTFALRVAKEVQVSVLLQGAVAVVE